MIEVNTQIKKGPVLCIILQHLCLVSLKPYLNYLSEPGLCYDESAECAEFARQGKCTNREVHQYANYCKHSCALCGESSSYIAREVH